MRKKTISVLLMILVILSTVFTVGASPVESKIGFLINNEIKPIPKDMGEPFLSNSRTFVPLRFVSETLGFKVEWEQKTQTATIKHTSGDVKVTIGSKTVTTPSGAVAMDVEAFLRNSRTYVPIRFVAEALGFEVDWVPAKNVEGSRDYKYDFYVTIDGELGKTVEGNVGDVDENGIGNVVSDNPADWPETDNPYQAEPQTVLSRNKAFVDYMEKNHKGKFFISGYSTIGDIDLAQGIAYSPYPDAILSVPAFSAYDLRHNPDYGYIDMNVSWYSVSKDVFEKTLYAYVGYSDGQYIFNMFDRGMDRSIDISQKTDILKNQWMKTPSGREFYFDFETSPSGINILIK